MQQAAFDFDDLPEILLPESTDDSDRARKERKLRRASNKHLRVLFNFVQNRTVGGQIDSKRLLPKQMFTCPDDVRIKLGMQMMRDCTIDGLYILTLQQRTVITGGEFQRRDILFEPAQGVFIRVTRRRENGSSIDIGQMAPTRGSAGKFPAHKAQPNESESNVSSHRVVQRSNRKGGCKERVRGSAFVLEPSSVCSTVAKMQTPKRQTSER